MLRVFIIQCINYRFVKESKDCKPNYCSFLRLKCITKSDAGNYTCRIQTDEGSYDSLNSFWLDVHGRTTSIPAGEVDRNLLLIYSILPHIEPIKVVNRSLKHRVPLNPSGETNLMCVFEGRGIRNVSWSKLDNLDVISLPTRFIFSLYFSLFLYTDWLTIHRHLFRS